jgi:hypothetical protein
MSQTSGKLRAITIATPNLRADKQNCMWEVFCRYYDDVDKPRFEADLHEKSDVILLYDTGDKSLQGFSTLQLIPGELDNCRYLAIYSGDTIINEGYWGQTALQRAFTRYVLWQMVIHPTLPVYWFLISKGYKTYLLLSRNYVEHWPRWEEPTPPFQKGIIDQLSRNKFGDAWKPDLGVLQFGTPQGKLKETVAETDHDLLRQYRDIQFFNTANPNHRSGDELCCLGRVNPAFIFHFAQRTTRKVLGIRPRSTVWKSESHRSTDTLTHQRPEKQ